MQGAAKPAVNEPMAYSKLKAVTAGTASDPANGTAQTAPSEGSAQRSQVYICLRLVTTLTRLACLQYDHCEGLNK